jgi:hypothetical protein
MDDKAKEELRELIDFIEAPDTLLRLFQLISEAPPLETEPEEYSPFIYPH